MTAETLFYYLGGFRSPGKLDQRVMIRDILWVTFGATHRSPVPFLVTAHALPMVGTLESDSPGQLRIEGFLVTRRTPGGFRGLEVHRPVMMADEAILENSGVFLVHKSHRAVEILFSLDDRVVQEEVVVLHVLELQCFNTKAGPTLGKGFFEHFFDEGNHFA